MGIFCANDDDTCANDDEKYQPAVNVIIYQTEAS